MVAVEQGKRERYVYLENVRGPDRAGPDAACWSSTPGARASRASSGRTDLISTSTPIPTLAWDRMRRARSLVRGAARGAGSRQLRSRPRAARACTSSCRSSAAPRLGGGEDRSPARWRRISRAGSRALRRQGVARAARGEDLRRLSAERRRAQPPWPPLSVRARAGGPVSTPIAWEALASDVRGAYFNLRNVPEQLARQAADPSAGLLAHRGTAHAPDAPRSGRVSRGYFFGGWSRRSFASTSPLSFARPPRRTGTCRRRSPPSRSR